MTYFHHIHPLYPEPSRTWVKIDLSQDRLYMWYTVERHSVTFGLQGYTSLMNHYDDRL